MVKDYLIKDFLVKDYLVKLRLFAFLRQGATQAARALSQINQRLYSSTFCVNHHFARWFHKHTLRHVFKFNEVGEKKDKTDMNNLQDLQALITFLRLKVLMTPYDLQAFKTL